MMRMLPPCRSSVFCLPPKMSEKMAGFGSSMSSSFANFRNKAKAALTPVKNKAVAAAEEEPGQNLRRRAQAGVQRVWPFCAGEGKGGCSASEHVTQAE